MNEILVVVNENHILQGTKNSCSYCPIARALRETVGYGLPQVGLTCVTLGHTVYDLPEIAQEFIMNFDFDEHVEPFEFTLIPQKLQPFRD